jgi:hypothetical protein
VHKCIHIHTYTYTYIHRFFDDVVCYEIFKAYSYDDVCPNKVCMHVYVCVSICIVTVYTYIHEIFVWPHKVSMYVRTFTHAYVCVCVVHVHAYIGNTQSY